MSPSRAFPRDSDARRRARVQAVLAGRATDATAPAVHPGTTSDRRTLATPGGYRAGTRAPSPTRTFLILGNLGPGATQLHEALERTGEITVVGSSSDPLQAIDDVAATLPDVVLVDRFVSIADGLVVARHLHHDVPHVAIVLRTPWPDADRHDAARAGLRAVIDIATPVSDLVHALRAAAARH